MLGCKGDRPDAGTTADVDHALVRRGGYGSTVEAIELNEPQAVLEVCTIGQRGPEESPYGRQRTQAASLGLGIELAVAIHLT